MKKIVLLLNLFICFIIIIPSNILAYDSIDFYSEKVIVYDITSDKKLYGNLSDEKSSIASLTKIMTTIVAIEMIDDVDEEITITRKMLNEVPWDASVAGLKVGDVVTYKDLLYASMLASGADATNSLAVSLTGSVNNFVDKMNALAKKLEMNNSHFVNVTGYDEYNHYSTLEDLMLLVKYVFKNDTFVEILTTNTYELSNNLKVNSTLNYYNKKMYLDLSDILGSKTGFTSEAGYCLFSYFKVEDHDFVSITLNAERLGNNYYNLTDAVNIINESKNNYGYTTIYEDDDELEMIDVLYSKIDQYKITPKNDILVFIEKDYNKDNLSIVYEGDDNLSYKDKINSKIGTVKIYYEDTLLTTEDVFLEEEIKPSILKLLWLYKYYLLGSLVLLFIFIKLIKKKNVKKKSKRLK